MPTQKSQSISEKLFSYVQQLQKESEQSFEQYPKNSNLLPEDAIAFLRERNVKAVCDVIQTLVEGSGKSLEDVLNLSIQPNLSEICSTYQHTSPAIEAIISKFGKQK